MVSSINCPWLRLGVTMLILGHGSPPGIVSGNCWLTSVHGQPVLPGGGGGSSFKVGQLIMMPFLLEITIKLQPAHVWAITRRARNAGGGWRLDRIRIILCI